MILVRLFWIALAVHLQRAVPIRLTVRSIGDNIGGPETARLVSRGLDAARIRLVKSTFCTRTLVSGARVMIVIVIVVVIVVDVCLREECYQDKR